MQNNDLHFVNSPLTEAIIDIRVAPSQSISLDDLARLQEGEEERYPDQKPRVFVEGMISTDLDQPAAVGNRTQIGYVYTSTDGRNIAQAHLDGFTFSRLAPYERWQTFCNEARRLWAKYRSLAKPDTITRMAVRYVNKFNIPLSVGDLKDYFTILPDIPPSIPNGSINGLFLQLHIPQDDIKSNLILTETILPIENPGFLPFVVDFDLFRTEEILSDEESIWDFFEVLHVRKNELFLAAVTEKTKELINGSNYGA